MNNTKEELKKKDSDTSEEIFAKETVAVTINSSKFNKKKWFSEIIFGYKTVKIKITSICNFFEINKISLE